MSNRIKIGFVSLGCSKNQIDTEIMLAHLNNAGFEITGDAEEAEVIVVNTCGFIGDAKQESYEAIEDMAELKETAKLKKLIVAGCLAERYRDQIMAQMPFIDGVIGVGSIHKIVDAVRKAFEGDSVLIFDDAQVSDLDGDRMLLGDTYSAYMRVSEGCNNRCTYCAIPMIRGKHRSRTMESLIDEAKKLDAAGVKELNLIAQDTSSYGIDLYGKLALPDLLKKITQETNIPWIRLFYCYPDKITNELIAEMRDNPRILKYIDIPVQHINDAVLKRMNRHGNRAMIEGVIKKLRDAMPEIVIRTTAIVGFPGETEEQFNELVDFAITTRFNRFGAFAYSREEGTPAYDFDDQIDEDEKLDRYEAIMAAQADVSADYQREFIGKTELVLCEGFDDEQALYVGRNASNGPDVDGKVYFASKAEVKAGDFVHVKIKDADDYDLFGVLVKSKK